MAKIIGKNTITSGPGIAVDSTSDGFVKVVPDNLSLNFNGSNQLEIKPGGVAYSALGALNVSIALDAGPSNSTTSTGFSQPPNQSISLTTSGRPVKIECISTTTAPAIGIQSSSASVNPQALYRILRDGTEIWRGILQLSNGVGFLVVPAGVINAYDAPAAGPHTYALQYAVAYTSGAGVTAFFNSLKILAYEIG